MHDKLNDALSITTNTVLNNTGEAFAFSLHTRFLSWTDPLKCVINIRSENSIGHVSVTNKISYDSSVFFLKKQDKL